MRSAVDRPVSEQGVLNRWQMDSRFALAGSKYCGLILPMQVLMHRSAEFRRASDPLLRLVLMASPSRVADASAPPRPLGTMLSVYMVGRCSTTGQRPERQRPSTSVDAYAPRRSGGDRPCVRVKSSSLTRMSEGV
jgi:hypothetical protein